MSKKSLLVTIFSMLLPAISLAGSFNGWIYQNPYPTSNTLLAVKFVTQKKGWVAGEKGTILYTEDSGDTWEAQESGTEQDIKSLAFVNEKQGWAVGNGGTIIHTEDGGKTWVSQGGSETAPLNKLFFLNEKEGWAVGMSGLVLHTTDGGKKWEKQDIGIKRAIASIYFMNPQTGWILAGDEVYRTIDGGKNWGKSLLDIKIPRSGKVGKDVILSVMGEEIPEEWWIGDIVFADEKEGWAVVGLWFIFHTEDGGKAWSDQLKTGYMSYGVNAVSFMDKKNGCAGGSSIICTVDGGKTWKERLDVKPGQRKMIKEFDVAVSNIQFIGNKDGWAVGTEGQIFKTEDGGKNWNMEAKRNECGEDAFFTDKQTGWLYGVYGHNHNTYICRTDDGGQRWEKQEVGIKVWNIFFTDNLTGWAVGWLHEADASKPDRKRSEEKQGKVWAVIKNTSDGGKTWSTQFTELISKDLLDRGLYGIYFINHNVGWAGGEKGIIIHTDDGGKNWKHQRKRNAEITIGDIIFIDNKIGWALGNKSTDRLTGVLLYTKDGGEHWQTYKEYKDIYLDGIYFVDKMSGWVMGKTEDEDAHLFYTTDGGKTWSENKSKDFGYGQPAFLDKERGVITDKGFLFVTEDGGKTWKTMRTPIAKYPWHFSDIFKKDDKAK